MKEFHNLLKRQLERCFDKSFPDSEEWRKFIDMVNDAYREFDADRLIVERSLELSSKELLQANSDLRAVFHALPDLFLWLAEDGTVLSCKEESHWQLFIPTKKLIGKRFQDMPVGNLREIFQEAIDCVHEMKDMVNLEYSLTICGEEQHYEARLLPILEGKILVVIRNITAWKHAEQSLASEKEHLAVTLRSIEEGVITTNTSGTVMLVNQAAEMLTGWSSREAIGKPLEEIFRVFDVQSAESRKNLIQKFIQCGEFIEPSSHLVLVGVKGGMRIISTNGAPIRDEENNIIGLVLVFRDITDKQKSEAERFKATKLESVGILAGGIAHDFNNLLSAILGNISIAQMQLDPDSDTLSVLAKAEKASLRARDLTQQLLTFSKGGSPVKKTSSITELIKDSTEFALRGSNVRCEYSLPDDLWLIEMDGGQIGQVFHNLTINADQAMPQGGILKVKAENIVVTSKEMLPVRNGKYVKISVEDCGMGIAEEHISKIFDPYFTTKKKGSGLGLAGAYSIIRKHDGLLTATSEVGIGTCFHVFLPASEKEFVIEKKPDAGMVMGSGKILIMDDEEIVREVTEHMLKSLGYTVGLAHDGKEAIKLYKEAMASNQPFDAVIMDLTIPGGMGGRETIRMLLEVDPDVRAIVSSGYANDPIMSNFEEYGFLGVIPKPFKVQELSVLLVNVISKGFPGPNKTIGMSNQLS